MNETVMEKAKRPTSITVICVIGFIGVLLSIPVFLSGLAAQVGDWYPPYLALSIVVGLASMIGMWMMKKWGAYLYTAMAAINQLVLLATGTWNPMALIVPAVVVFFALRHVGKMS